MESGRLFSFGLIGILLLACPFTAPAQENAGVPPAQNEIPPPPPGAAELPPAPEGQGNAQLEAQWATITKGNVEQACLSSAKEEAVASGYSGSLVFSCSCSAQESEGYKSYNCDISAADGSHALSAACTKSEQSCVINSEKGTVTYTFEELMALVG